MRFGIHINNLPIQQIFKLPNTIPNNKPTPKSRKEGRKFKQKQEPQIKTCFEKSRPASRNAFWTSNKPFLVSGVPPLYTKLTSMWNNVSAVCFESYNYYFMFIPWKPLLQVLMQAQIQVVQFDDLCQLDQYCRWTLSANSINEQSVHDVICQCLRGL